MSGNEEATSSPENDEVHAGLGVLNINDSLVTVFTREQRIATYLHNLVAVGREGAVQDGASLEQLAELDEAIQWLNEKMKG